MLRPSLRALSIAAVAACLLAPPPAAAVTPVDSCRDLAKAGETFILTANISSSSIGETCLRVTASRITVDLAGHAITGSNSSIGSRGIAGVGVTAIVVKNGTIDNFDIGIDLETSSRNTIRNVILSGNGRAIVAGAATLLKDCTVRGNSDPAIELGDGGQVEGCLIEGNSEGGIFGGNRMLVTRNIITGNSDRGIEVGDSSTVTNNTVNFNVDGIVVGQRSLVTGNTVNNNDETGIEAGEGSTVTNNTANRNDTGLEVECPSTVLNNRASNNGDENFNLVGEGCFEKNNTSPPLP